MATYEIILKNQSSTKKQAVAGANSNAGASKSFAKVTGSEKSSSIGDLAVGMIALNQVKQMALSEVSYQASTVQLRTGSTLQQEKVNFAMRTATEAASFVALSAKAITTLDPVAAIAAIMVPVNKMLEINRRQRTLDLQESIESQSIERNMIRAGSKGSRSSYE